MLTLDHIRTMRVLMARATLKGEEVPAYNELMAALAAEEQRELTPPTLPPMPPPCADC